MLEEHADATTVETRGAAVVVKAASTLRRPGRRLRKANTPQQTLATEPERWSESAPTH
jgi:hypothetical protein